VSTTLREDVLLFFSFFVKKERKGIVLVGSSFSFERGRREVVVLG
jgi:hypothetical protein